MLWEVAGIRVSRKWLINVAVALGILGILSVVLYATPFGRSMRACAVNPVGAALAGIPVRAIWFATYILDGLLAGIAGILILNTTGMDYRTASASRAVSCAPRWRWRTSNASPMRRTCPSFRDSAASVRRDPLDQGVKDWAGDPMLPERHTREFQRYPGRSRS
jgi:Branched-chain amino acid transport system / permease component